MIDDDDISDTLAAKSDQMNAVELIGGDITVTVDNAVKVPGKEQPVWIYFVGDYQPYKPCVGMRRLLAHFWGTRLSTWIGKKMTLYFEPTVIYGGKKTGGIRIKALSHIAKSDVVPVKETRTNIVEYKIDLLQDADTLAQKSQPSIADRVERAIAAYRDCNTAEELMALGAKTDQLRAACDDAHKLKLTAVFEARMNAFNEGEN